MSETEPLLLRFWGKTPQRGAPPERFHPAVFHMIDVACVAEVLLHDGPARLRTAISTAWRGSDETALLAWLPFLIATHDLGKISAPFQGQAKSRATQEQRDRLAGEGVRFGSPKSDLYHAEVSALWLDQHLLRREPGTPARLLWVVRDAIGGHHGRFCQTLFRTLDGYLQLSERPEPRWSGWREAAYTLLRSLFDPQVELATVGVPQSLPAATVALTGLIVWCDWVGSNELDFPATPDLTPAEYLALSRQRAQQAARQHHLLAERTPQPYQGFRSLFPDEPRPLQQLIDRLPDTVLHGPLLVVIEAPTGEGKTEAALALAQRIAAHNGIDELFFALPTMATSNQMFLRLEAFFNRRYGTAGAVRLVHGQALLLEDGLRRRVALAPDSDPADPQGASAGAALEWFVGPKKGMLAPFGVGTVDQIELAGLQVRHYPLRLYGLAHKIIVLDEVHAYDTYMSTILAHTLGWLAGLGCTVIMLSATLPLARHRELAQAFLAGLPGAPPPDLPEQQGYPALAIYHADGTWRPDELCQVFRPAQSLSLRLTPLGSPAEEARALLELVSNGGAVARICNRVDDAQAIYAALQAQSPPEEGVLLHARFPLNERQAREQRIDSLVGKESSRQPEQRLIIVGTQVLEQSLDYDVDVMVSDCAPIDLLLQRAGRLHRHERKGRPARHARAVLYVRVPLDGDLPVWRRWAPIYEPYILWRTWEVLHAGTQRGEFPIILPRDYRRLIEAVYAEQPRAASDPRYVEELARAQTRFTRTRDEQAGQARRVLTPSVRSPDLLTAAAAASFVGEEESPEARARLAKTRLGDRITVVPVYDAGDWLALDHGLTQKFSRDTLPALDDQRDLLGASVPVSDRRVIAAYHDEHRPPTLRWPWPERELPALVRNLYPLLLDRNHTARLGGCLLRLDADLGLMIDQEEL